MLGEQRKFSGYTPDIGKSIVYAAVTLIRMSESAFHQQNNFHNEVHSSKNRLKCDRSKIISKDFLDLKHKMLLLSLTNLLLYTKRIFFLNFNFVT